MKKFIILLLMLLLLGVGCITRDNIFDPKGDDYVDPGLKSRYTLTCSNIEDTVAVLHFKINNETIDSSYLLFGTGINENILFSDSVMDIVIIEGGLPITGTMDIASIILKDSTLIDGIDYSISLKGKSDQVIVYDSLKWGLE